MNYTNTSSEKNLQSKTFKIVEFQSTELNLEML